MSCIDVDEILNHLSIKFNKIFCEREFVCCVNRDLQIVLNNTKEKCILVFPTLGPIYLKALRYQALLSDLAVFNISSASGRFKSLAVCHKDQLKKTMPTSEPTRRKRPERQLYVPPAQRHSKNVKISERVFSDRFTLSDVNLVSLIGNLPIRIGFRRIAPDRHYSCQFKCHLNHRHFKNFIKIYDSVSFFNDIYFNLNFSLNERSSTFSFHHFDTPIDKPLAILIDFESNDRKTNEFEYNSIQCDIEEYFDNIINLDALGHWFLIPIDGSEYIYECQEIHDATVCYKNVRQRLELAKRNVPKVEPAPKSNIKSDTIQTKKEIVKNGINKKKKVVDNKHEQEKEIMRMTKEYINRKTRPLMKYVDDDNDTLKIDHDSSLNNWEDLFDDDGQIQEGLLTEIVDKVGDELTIVTATEDYTEYTNKPPEDLEHIVELYNFPSTLETHDLVQAFSEINSDAMYIKWVDDTHALLVLGSLSQAQKAMSMRNPMIKVRPMTDASPLSINMANTSDLRPAMKRPATNLQTARRLITSHLGTKTRVTKEQMAKEKQDLKNAREMKRLLKQSEKDAWEGNLRSSVN